MMLLATVRTGLSRILSVSLAVALAYSGSASGWNGLAEEAAEATQEQLRRVHGSYTDRPLPVFRGSSPRRDSARSAWWTPAAKRALESARLRWQMDAADYVAGGFAGSRKRVGISIVSLPLILANPALGAPGRNNPALQGAQNIGPVPVGRYKIKQRRSKKSSGKRLDNLPLTPVSRKGMYGRGGFLIHPGNPAGDPSAGCIILVRGVMDLIEDSGDDDLTVFDNGDATGFLMPTEDK